ncbi:MAG: hypothetical protein ACXADY_18810, partial [Candidatus Hodarchaeales archaeon]
STLKEFKVLEPKAFLDDFILDLTNIREENLPDLNEKIQMVEQVDFDSMEKQIHSLLEEITKLLEKIPKANIPILLNKLRENERGISRLERDIGSLKTLWMSTLKEFKVLEPEASLDELILGLTNFREKNLPDLYTKIQIVEQIDSKIRRVEQHVHSIQDEMQVQISPLMISVPKKIELEPIVSKREILVPSKSQQGFSTRLSSFVTEKIVSNLFGFFGAAFLIVGFAFAVGVSFNTILQKPDVEPGLALLYVLAFYAGAFFLLLFSLLILPRGIKRFPWINNFIGPASSLAFILVVVTSLIQVFYFENAPMYGETIFLGLMILALSFAGTLIAYLAKRQSLAITGITLGMMISYFVADQGVFPPKGDTLFGVDMVFGTIGLVLFFSFLLLASIFVMKRQYWLPFAEYCLFSPVLWFLGSNKVAFPEILLLSVSIAAIALVVTKKMPTPRPFSHFLATLFLIYPNLVAILILQQSAQKYASTYGYILILILILVFGAFFVLYWIFIFLEHNLQISFAIPSVSKLSEEKTDIQQDVKNLNWIFLLSIFFVGLTWITLSDLKSNLEIGTLLMFFPLLLIGTAIVGMIINIERYVSNSIFLMIFTSELLFFMTYIQTQLTTHPIFIAIFLILLASIFEVANRKKTIIYLYQTEILFEWTIIGISLLSFFNTILFLFINSAQGAIFLLISIISWSLMSISGLLWMDQSVKQIKTRHMAPIIGITILIFGAIFNNWLSTSFEISVFNHLVLNLSFVIFPIIALVSVYFGFPIIKSSDTQILKSSNSDETSFLMQFIDENTYHLPQVIILLLPTVYMAYSKSYFFKEVNLQVLFGFYLVLYIISLPMFLLISKRRNNQSIGALSIFSGFYAFLAGFILIGPTLNIYDLIFGNIFGLSDLGSGFIGGISDFPLQWVIIGFIAIFAICILLTTLLTHQPKLDLESQKINRDSGDLEKKLSSNGKESNMI